MGEHCSLSDPAGSIVAPATMAMRGSIGFGLLMFLAVFVLARQESLAQGQYRITQVDISACSGVFEDSGGPGNYSSNENITAVVCPTTTGDAIALQWLIWSLDASGTPQNRDRIRIWDGNSTAGTFLGEYTANDPLTGVIFQAGPSNPSGCLTVQFLSNPSGVGNFAAIISCSTPCERPTAVGTMSEGTIPARVCVGEEIFFDGTGSMAHQGFHIVDHIWSFDDGTSASGVTASHSFSEPGEYAVQLSVLDNNGCINANSVDLTVQVSTTPDFTGTLGNIISCAGATVDLSAVVEPTTWVDLPGSNFGGALALGDSQEAAFTTGLAFTQFAPGQTLTNIDDLLSVCVSMEHSYMGDLVISITCPNGTMVAMHEQGGGGTFLGDANDSDADWDIQPGTCWDYCWSPNTTQGTWAQSAQYGVSQNIMPAPSTSGANSLVPGTYSSSQALSTLVGCPLNGTWTLTIADILAMDNGAICSWSVQFSPSIFPDLSQFTPVLGSSIDSSGWNGPGLAIDPMTPLRASATLTEPGDHTYSFQVTDNFGCSYDTTMTVTVHENPVIDAGPDITLCSDPVTLGAEHTNIPPPAPCTYRLRLSDSGGDMWSDNANINVTIDGVTTNHRLQCCAGWVDIPLQVMTGSTITLDFIAGTNWNHENSFTLFDATGIVLYQSPYAPSTGQHYTGTVQCPGAFIYVFEWTPTDGLSAPNQQYTDVLVSETTMFHVTSHPAGYPGCAVTDSVLVRPDPSIDAGLPASITLCAGYSAIQMTDSLRGTPDPGGVWTNPLGQTVVGTFNPGIDPADSYTYTVTSTGGCIATSTLAIVVIPLEDPACCGSIDAGEPTFSCYLTIGLEAQRGNSGTGNWEGPAEAVFADRSAPSTTVTMPPGMGGTHMFYWVENDGAFCNLIDSVEKTFTDAYVFTWSTVDALCYGYCDGRIAVEVQGGNAHTGLVFSWSSGHQGVGMDTIDGLCAGIHTLIVTDDNGCTGSMGMTINQPALLDIDTLAALPVTCSGDCDGTVFMSDAEAVEYSFDDGATWTTDVVRPEACEGIWMLRIKDAIGCSGSASIEVTGPPPVIAAFDWGPQPANVDAPTITFGNQSSGADRYFWNIAGLLSTTDKSTSFTFNNKDPGTYEVCLEAYAINECSDITCQRVVIDDVLFTYIPNTFTPDGDNVNDDWWPSANIPVRTDYELLVFDRWGQVVFSTTDPYKAWSGSHQNSGEILKSDVYIYRLRYGVGSSEARKEIIGHVTLMR